MSQIETAVRRASAREMPRAEVSAAIAARLEALGAPSESVAAARRIAERRSVVVVAGQQPVLLAGPGLVWAKACHAIALARRISADHGVPAVAVFWNASEDHDHAECDHVAMALGDGVETLRVPLAGDRTMLSHVLVPAEATALVGTLRARLAQGPSRDDLLAAIEPSADDTMGSWFSRILLRVLGPHGLVVVEPQTLRSFARPVVDFEIERPGEFAARIRAAEEIAAALGQPPSIELARDELFFLVENTGRRLKVERAGNEWRVEDGSILSTDEMRSLPDSAFSWNVVTRVLAQDVALPVAAQVCGPSEIRYCERLAELHAFLGVPQPALVARTSWLFFTAGDERRCRALGIDPASLSEAGLRDLDARDDAPEPAEVAALRELVAKAPSEGSAAVQRRHAALVHGVEAYGDALRREAKERALAADSRRSKLLASLFPGGEPQDRSVSPLPWLAQMGHGALAEHIATLAAADAAGSQAVMFRVGAPGPGEESPS